MLLKEEKVKKVKNIAEVITCQSCCRQNLSEVKWGMWKEKIQQF